MSLGLVSKREGSKLLRDFYRVRDALIIAFPYLSPILRRVKPVFIDAENFTAGVTGQSDRIYISVQYWNRLKPGEKAFVILHETLHLALQHGVRGLRMSYPQLYNISADAIINEFIINAVENAKRRKIPYAGKIRAPFGVVTYRTIVDQFDIDVPYERFIRMSADELYYMMLRKLRLRGLKNIPLPSDIIPDVSEPIPKAPIVASPETVPIEEESVTQEGKEGNRLEKEQGSDRGGGKGREGLRGIVQKVRNMFRRDKSPKQDAKDEKQAGKNESKSQDKDVEKQAQADGDNKSEVGGKKSKLEEENIVKPCSECGNASKEEERKGESSSGAGGSAENKSEGGVGGGVDLPSNVPLGEGLSGLGEDLSTWFMYSKCLEALAKVAGTESAHLYYMIEKLVKARIKWREILRASLDIASRGRVISTWKRPNRRCDHYPGHVKIDEGKLEIYCLVDVSGSIVSEPHLLEDFFSEVMEIAKLRRGTIWLIPWDTEVKGTYKITDIASAKKAIEEAGKDVGGGTIIDPALQYVVKELRKKGTIARNKNVVIILSDGLWINEEPRLFKEIRQLTKKAIYIYTIEDHPELEGWTRIQYIR